MAAEWLTKVAKIGESKHPHHRAVMTEYSFVNRRFEMKPYVWHKAEAIRALVRYERVKEPIRLEEAHDITRYLLVVPGTP